jgi:hypothetical protein
MVNIFQFPKTGSLFIQTEDCGFFLDKDGNLLKETGFIRNTNICEKISSQLVFIKEEYTHSLPSFIQQPLMLSSVA